MRYTVIVKPGTSQERIIETAPGELMVCLRAKAHDGEANEALIKALSKYFNIPKTSIAITRGVKSRHKQIEI